MTANGLTAIDGGLAPSGWEGVWASDRWPLRELPHADLQSTGRDGAILFEGIGQPWLKEAAKRWARARLLAGGAPTTMSNYVHHVSEFSAWLADRVPEVVSPAGITRTVLEDWLLAIRSSGLAAGTKTSRVSAVRVFLEEQWEDGLARMPRGATIHPGEIPSADYRLPRGIEGPVFDQLIDPANLALLPSEQHRTLILLLAFTGLRISSIVTLPRDALEIGSDGHPYLRYLNVKLRREAVIPIGPALHEQLRRQERLLTDTLGVDGTPFLLPSPPAGRRGSSRGEHHVSIRGVRHTLKRYVLTAEIRDSTGRLASWVHPHRFRHHLGTSLVNEGIPLPVIQRVLDHGSIRMTARYAHLDDETVKREMASFHERVNVRGGADRAADRRAAGGGGVDEGADRARQTGAPERVLRTAAGAVMPAPKRVPELRQLPHRRLVSPHPRAPDRPHPGAARPCSAERECAAGRAARGGRTVTATDPRGS